MSIAYNLTPPLSHKWPAAFLAQCPLALEEETVERLLIGYFDARHQLLQTGDVCSDLIDGVAIPLREIVGKALMLDACSLILAHNHPAGDPRPSRVDIEQTRNIARALKPLNIHIDDHVIIASKGHFSFRAAGLL